MARTVTTIGAGARANAGTAADTAGTAEGTRAVAAESTADSAVADVAAAADVTAAEKTAADVGAETGSAARADAAAVDATGTADAAAAEDSGVADWAPPVRRGGRWALLGARAARLARRPGFVLASLFAAFVIVASFAPSLFTPYDPYATAPAERLDIPSAAHLFGTDDIGRDLWSRTLYGSELTVQAALIAIGIALCAGLALGVVSGFFGGRVDAVVMRGVDVLLAIPGMLLALAIVTALGFGSVPVAIAVGVATIPEFARTTRAQVLRVKTLPYVEAARAGGASWPRVLLRHILPNSWGPVLGLAVLDVGTAIIWVAALSFLGFGAAPPRAEWGSLVAGGRNYLVTAPWVSLLPGAVVVLTVLSLNHIAKTLQEVRR